MKKNGIILVIILITMLSVFSVTESDKSYKISIDGKTSDYDQESESLMRSGTTALESSFDSYWGEQNELTDIKCTWDSNYLYVAINGVINGNNFMVFLDCVHGGIPDFKPEDSSESLSWNRSLTFVNYYPDYYFGTWPDNSTPENYKAVSSIRDERIYNNSELESGAYFPSGINGAFEFKISWDELFNAGPGNVSAGAQIRISACITGAWGGSSADVMPDNSAGASSDGQQRVVMDNYAVIKVDSDNDGKPDIGVNPNERLSFIVPDLPHKPNPIDISNLKLDRKIISTVHGQKVLISFYLNISKTITVKVFNIKGDEVKTIIYDEPAVIGDNNIHTNPRLSWDGRDEKGKVVPEGVYIISVTDTDRTFRKLVSVAVVH